MSITHQWVAVDILKGESRTPEFLELNPNGQIPLLITDRGECLAESNAILFYLARDSHFLPDDVMQQARVLEWLFFEQYSHEPNIAVARFIARYLGMPEDRKADYERKQKGGNQALAIMEEKLQTSPCLVGDSCSIADISLYAYTHVAEEGGFDLSRYPAIKSWLKRIQSLPGFVGMDD